VNVERFEENYIEGNGWKCFISEKGRLDCIATEFYGGERHQIKLKIDKGYAKVLLKIGNGRPRALKSYLMQTWPVDGTIVLPAGYIDKRRPHFRNIDFQKFLDEYMLSAVRHEDPNKIYQLMLSHNGHAIVFHEEIDTDGAVKIISEQVKANEKASDGSFDVHQMAEVTNATWVIKNVWKNGEYKHRILYTLGDPKEIQGLPKLY